jgi:hypothetical protein
VGKGVSEIESGEALAAEDRAVATEIADQGQSADLRRAVERVVSEIEGAGETTRQITTTLAATKSIQDQTLTLAASSVKG